MTVLLVEDDKERMAKIKGYLESDNVNVLTARGGAEALKILYRTPVDHVLSDANMPYGEGFWIALKLKREPVFGHAKMLLYASKGMMGDSRRLADDIGVDACLTHSDPQGISNEVLGYIR